MSWSGWRTETVPVAVVPSANVSLIVFAPVTTWSAVRMSPAASTTTPVPRPVSALPLASTPVVWIVTRDGATSA